MSAKITGIVENVVYSNSETFFSVLEVDVGGELTTVVGELAGTAVGEEIIAYGEYAVHPSFGVQFKADAAERILPSGATAILRYLSSGAVPGVGPSLARRIVDAFGEKSLDVLANHPEKLERLRGFSKKKAAETAERFGRIFGLRESLSELASLSIETRDAIRLYRDFGRQAAEIIRDNPYMLCGYPVYKDFGVPDSLARSLGYEPEHVNRIRAGLVYILRHNMFNGHTCLPAERLVDKASEFLEIARDPVEIELWDAAESRLILSDRIDGEDFVFLPALFRGEEFIAERLALLNSLEYLSAEDAGEMIDGFQRRGGIIYEELQRKAIAESLKRGALVITGGPGTGKTTALNAVISLCEQQGDKVFLTAPTGRAAKRLSELTGREAKTIHRLLEVDYRGADEEMRFVHDENNPLKCDVTVIDEMSMVDVPLFESLLRGLRPQCRLIMVGDGNQLPAVGAGNLLRDIIDSERCPVIEFKKIFRQAAESGIVVNAHGIVSGRMPDISKRDGDFFFIGCENAAIPELVADLAARRLPKRYGLDPFSDIQVLSPQRNGLAGVGQLNEVLRERLNPADTQKTQINIMGRFFREGCRVMQVRNNYDIEYRRADSSVGLGVFNGDAGRVQKIIRDSGVIVVDFDDGRTVRYSFEQAHELEPAYAITVHKSQGSEFPAVILALSGTPRRLRYRNLLYTAVTRAKDILVIVGDEKVIADMVDNDKKSLRFTAVQTFMRRLSPPEKTGNF